MKRLVNQSHPLARSQFGTGRTFNSRYWFSYQLLVGEQPSPSIPAYSSCQAAVHRANEKTREPVRPTGRSNHSASRDAQSRRAPGMSESETIGRSFRAAVWKIGEIARPVCPF